MSQQCSNFEQIFPIFSWDVIKGAWSKRDDYPEIKCFLWVYCGGGVTYFLLEGGGGGGGVTITSNSSFFKITLRKSKKKKIIIYNLNNVYKTISFNLAKIGEINIE